MKMNEDYEKIMGLIEKEEEWRHNCLNMIASENVVSPSVTKAVASDLGHRYAEGLIKGKNESGRYEFERFYQGTKIYDKIESLAMKLAEDLFNADHANLVPISGVLANTVAFSAISKHGDKIISLGVPSGGHISHTHVSLAGVLGMKDVYYSFDNDEMNINVEESRKIILEEKPKVMVFGGSLFLFPHPVKELKDAAEEVGAKIVYDAAHVLGVIAGGKFQQPFEEGTHIVTASTHKTFPGPQGGIVMCTQELAKKIDLAAFPGMMSNHHLHHVAGMAVALAEMKVFGEEYATQTVKNAKALAQSLYEMGFKVLCEHKGFTESHQIAFNASNVGGGARVADTLEEANIILNKNLLPGEDLNNVKNPDGVRIGVQELTHIGMKESEMKQVAELIKRVVMDNESPEKVKADVVELKSRFMEVKYCFDS